MSARDAIRATLHGTGGWSGPKDQQNKTDILLCAFGVVKFYCPQEGHIIFVVSPVDPSFVECIIFHQHHSTDSTGKFHDIHGIQRCPWQFQFCRLQCEKYSGGCGSYDQSILNGVFNVFLPIKTTRLLYKVFLSSDLKKGKDIKYTNDVDVSNAPCCPRPTVLNPKNISAAVAATVVMSNPSTMGLCVCM